MQGQNLYSTGVVESQTQPSHTQNVSSLSPCLLSSLQNLAPAVAGVADLVLALICGLQALCLPTLPLLLQTSAF